MAGMRRFTPPRSVGSTYMPTMGTGQAPVRPVSSRTRVPSRTPLARMMLQGWYRQRRGY